MKNLSEELELLKENDLEMQWNDEGCDDGNCKHDCYRGEGSCNAEDFPLL